MAKLTESQLRSIIKKELRNVLNETDDIELAKHVQREFEGHTELFSDELNVNLNKLNNEMFKKKIGELISSAPIQQREHGEEPTLDRTKIANEIIRMCIDIKEKGNAKMAQAALDAYDDARLIANQKFRLNLPMTPY